MTGQRNQNMTDESAVNATIDIQVNGQPNSVESGSTLLQYLTAHRLGRGVAVELNGRVVGRAEYAATPLNPGDQLEIVTLAGGG